MFCLQVLSFTECFEQPRDRGRNSHRRRLLQVIPEPTIALHGAIGRPCYVRFDRRHGKIKVRETMAQNGPDLNPPRGDAHVAVTPCRYLIDVNGLREPPQPTPDTGTRPLFEEHRAIVAHYHDQYDFALRPIAFRAWRRNPIYHITLMRNAPRTQRTPGAIRFASRANRCAQIHDGLRIVRHAMRWCARVSKPP
jgi:hypothetical protein